MVKRLLGYLKPYKKSIVAVFILTIMLSILTLSNSWMMGQITDAMFYRTKGLQFDANVTQTQTKQYTLNIVKNSIWTISQTKNLVDDIRKSGLTVLTYQSQGNQISIKVVAPSNVSQEPLRMIVDMQKRLRSKYGELQIFIAASEDDHQKKGLVLFSGIYTIYILPILLVIIYLLRGLFSYVQGYMVGSIGQKVVMKLRNQIYENLHNLSISYFEQNTTGQTGQIISRITNDIDAITFLFTSGTDLVLQPVIVLIGLIWGFILNWKLTLLFFIMVPLIAFPMDYLTRKLRDVNTQMMNKIADITDVLQETLMGIKVVKAFNMEQYEVGRFQREIQYNYQTAIRSIRIGKVFLPIIEFIISIGLAIFFIYSGNLILDNTLTPSEFFTFVVLMISITDPIRGLSGIWSNIPRSLVAAERIFELIDQKSEVVEAVNPIQLDQIAGKVEFKNVSFGYNPQSFVLKNIDLKVAPGEIIAFVGPSGAGKTTMVNLAARFYDPTDGEVIIDGYNLRDLKLSSLRQAMGMVLQETILFKGTIAENIAYGKIDASIEEIIQAAQAANAHEFIIQMPNGYDTRVGSRGATLSGGQRQRIAIARAILRDPRILILDEATSALDTQSEIMVQEALQRLMKDRTCFIIAHRLSTIQGADRIVVMQDGKIVEVGNHHNLLAKSGLYAALYKTQFRDQEGVTINS